MMLCSAVGREFNISVRSRGSLLEQRSRVRRMTRVGDRVQATVVDGASHVVEIDWSDIQFGLLATRCSCAACQGAAACAHVWAVLQLIDRRQYLKTVVPPYVGLVGAEDEAGELSVGRAAREGVEPGSLDGGDAADAATTRAVPSDGEERGLIVRSARTWRDLARICRHSPPENGGGAIAQPLAKRRYWWVLTPAGSAGTDTVTIHCLAQSHRQTGGWGRIQSMLPPEPLAYDGALALDVVLARRVRELCRGQFGHGGFGYGYSRFGGRAAAPSNYGSDAITISASAAATLLPLLCEHDRFVWMFDVTQPIEDGRRVHWDDGPAYGFMLASQWDAVEECWRLEGTVRRSDEPAIPINQVVAFAARQFVLFEDRLARFRMPPVPAIVDWFRANRSIVVAPGDRVPFLQSVAAVVDPETLRGLPVELVGEILDDGLEPELHIDPEQCRGDTLVAEVRFVYEEIVLAPSMLRVHYDADHDRIVIRDSEAERAALTLLHDQLAPARGYRFDGQVLTFKARSLPSLVRTLLPLGWHVRVSGNRVRWPGEARFSVRSEIDWFDVHGQVDFDGVQVSLPRLLRAVKAGDPMITLDDGTQGMIPEDWLKRYGHLLQLGEIHEDTIRYRGSQALVLDALLAELDTVDVDATFRRIRRQLRAFDGVREVREPRGFRGELRPYQRCGLGWLRFLSEFDLGGCLADDMGLGKTVQVLALLQSRRTRRLRDGETRKPSLVVVPKSLVFNWIDEAARFAPRLRMLDYTGTDRHQYRETMANYDAVVTTYGTLQRDIGTLHEFEFDYAILDESTAIKNPNSQNAKACRLIQADHRLAMTGTPIENHLGELWSLFEFLNPGMLGSLTAFKSLTGKSSTVEDYQWLAQAIGPFVLRRTKEQVIKELPPKTEKTIHCEMSAKERASYDELRVYYQQQLSEKIKEQGLNRSKIHVLEALLRLRQAACHPALLDPERLGAPSAKLDTFLQLLTEVIHDGHKVLVFSQFTTFLSIVRDRLDSMAIRYEYLDGRTLDRKRRVDRFQKDDQCPVFLISLKAGGHGLNLTAADYVFILDPWWNPAVEAQAVDRTHRIGQTRPVFAYRFVAKQTVEDKVLQLQEKKRDLAEAVITANESLIRRMTADDLQMLLG